MFKGQKGLTIKINGKEVSNEEEMKTMFEDLIYRQLAKGMSEKIVTNIKRKINGSKESEKQKKKNKKNLTKKIQTLDKTSIIFCLNEMKKFVSERNLDCGDEEKVYSVIRDFIPRDLEEQKVIMQMIQNKTLFLKKGKLEKSSSLNQDLGALGFNESEIKKIL